MLQDLIWRTLAQRRIDSRLVLLYKVTYDLVAIPAADYLVRNTRPSTRTHSLAYRQISTLEDYYKFTFFPRTIPTGMPYQPTCLSSLPWHSLVQLSLVGGGGGGVEVTARSFWYGCANQYFKTYPIHIPGL